MFLFNKLEGQDSLTAIAGHMKDPLDLTVAWLESLVPVSPDLEA